MLGSVSLQLNMGGTLGGGQGRNTYMRSVYRQVDERKELINDYVVKKRKATDQMQSNHQEKMTG